jgi:hypothetical protein
VRGLLSILPGVLLLANAAAAVEPDAVHTALTRDLTLQIERETGQRVAERGSGALELLPPSLPASMQCVDYTAGAAECVVRLRSGVGGRGIQLSSLRTP